MGDVVVSIDKYFRLVNEEHCVGAGNVADALCESAQLVCITF